MIDRGEVGMGRNRKSCGKTFKKRLSIDLVN